MGCDELSGLDPFEMNESSSRLVCLLCALLCLVCICASERDVAEREEI